MNARINVMRKGDRVLQVSDRMIAIERKDKTVDLIPVIWEGELMRVDTEKIVTVGYGENTVSVPEVDGVVITTF